MQLNVRDRYLDSDKEMKKSPRRDKHFVLVLLTTPKHRYLRLVYNIGITSRENGRRSKLAKS